MKLFLLLWIATLAGLIPPLVADDLPKTLLATPGKLLVTEDFSKPLPPPVGSTAQFASGFRGWRCNVAPRGGHWEVVDGAFKGVENAAVQHPATASLGFDFKDVIITCEVRLHDVPLDGRKYRGFSIRTTDAKDYVCSIMLNETGMRIQKDDNDHAGPDVAVPLGQLKSPIKLGEWQKVTFEIFGDEMVATLNGQSLTGQHALIAAEKRASCLSRASRGACAISAFGKRCRIPTGLGTKPCCRLRVRPQIEKAAATRRTRRRAVLRSSLECSGRWSSSHPRNSRHARRLRVCRRHRDQALR